MERRIGGNKVLFMNRHREESVAHTSLMNFVRSIYKKYGITTIEKDFTIKGYKPDFYYIEKTDTKKVTESIECLSVYSIASDPDIIEKRISKYLRIADGVTIVIPKNIPVLPIEKHFQASSQTLKYRIWRSSITSAPDFVVHIKEFADDSYSMGFLITTPPVFPLTLPPSIIGGDTYRFDYKFPPLKENIGGLGILDMPVLYSLIEEKKYSTQKGV